MKVEIKQLVLKNYKSHQDLTVNFGERTEITGDNAVGKSSTGEAIPYTLYGTDLLGSKLDPTPITYEADETLVSLLLEIDGKQVLLGRALRKGKTQYYINEVPVKAGQFNELVDSLFDRDLFLSLYNPSFFPSLHWEKQRAMILEYVSTPLTKEVLKCLPEAQAKALETGLKKHSLEDLEKIHKENKRKQDKAYIAAQSRTKTLKEQLEEQAPTVPLDSLKAELDQLTKQRDEINQMIESADDNNRDYTVLENEIDFLENKKRQLVAETQRIKNEPINETCSTCGQPLKEESIKKIKQDKKKRIAELVQEFNEAHLKQVKHMTQLSEMEYIDVTEQFEKMRELSAKIEQIEREILKHSQYEAAIKMVEEAESKEKEILESLNNSIFILDSIKEFRAKEAELQVEKVQSLFETLSIKLFETLKNGEMKPTFEIELDGKPYRKLSLSESIRAGLEMREVLSKQSGLIAPVFLDNSESITKFKEPTGQLIVARVLAGQKLKIEAVSP